MDKPTSLLMVLVLLSGNAFAEEKFNVATIFFPDALTIQAFDAVSIKIHSQPDKKLLSKDKLLNYLKLRIKNNFSDIKYKKREYDERKKYTEKEKGEHAYLYVKIKSIGDDYPIAYSVQVGIGSFAKCATPFTTDGVGYASKENIESNVKDMINSLIESSAITFYKARGEM